MPWLAVRRPLPGGEAGRKKEPERSVENLTCDLLPSVSLGANPPMVFLIGAWAQGLGEAPPLSEVNQYIRGLGERD